MAIEKWQILDQEVVFEHPRMVLVEDLVLLPDGQQTKYLKYKHAGDAATIVAMRDERILVQREYSHPPSEILYQFPGGGVPAGEDPSEGANRELMEECGMRGTLREIGSYYIDNRRMEAKMYVFVATDLEDAKLPGDDEEFLEHEWYSEDQIDELLRSGAVTHSHMLATWTLFKLSKQKR
jgi:8-oxo-dGTP pyrophosphatase MutT (NUDIX family)